MTMFERGNSGSISGSRGTHYFGDRPQECMVHALCFAMLVDCSATLYILYMLCVFVFFSSAFLLHLKLLYFVYAFFVFLCCISSVQKGFKSHLTYLTPEGRCHMIPKKGRFRTGGCEEHGMSEVRQSLRSKIHQKWRSHGEPHGFRGFV